MTGWKPALTLIAIATLLPELASGNTPLSAFLGNPATLLLFVIAYGLPVLAMREFAVRRNIGTFGLFIMGLAYGLLNEGLIAKTNTMPTGLPMPAYSDYGQTAGINLPWAAALMLWHAVCSVLFPILATEWLFAGQGRTPWLSRWLAILAGAIAILFGCLVFLGDFRGHGSLPLLILYLLVMTAIVSLAMKIGKRRSDLHAPPSKGPLILGMTTALLLFVALSVIAENKLPPLLFFAVLIAGCWWHIWMLRRKLWTDSTNLLLFCIGCYIPTALVSLILALQLPQPAPDRIVMACTVLVVMIVAAVKVLRRKTKPA